MSYIEENAIEISCSWDVENEKSIKETLTVSTSDSSSTWCELENMVHYESCVHLLGTNNSICELKIKSILPSNVIAQICIVSEARIIELYGKHGEYLTTTRADFIDDFEDMSVYNAEIKLPEKSTECLLKLMPTKRSEQSIWMYGVNVGVEKLLHSKSIDSSVNFDNVNKIIKESGQQLTEKAEKCKAFLQQYSSMSVIDPSKLPGKPPDPQILMKMLQAAYLPQGQGLGEQAKNVSKCLTDLLPGFSLIKPKSEPNDLMGGTRQDYPQERRNEIIDLDIFKDHIDKQLEGLETRLTKILDDRLKEAEIRQNSKLDMILMRLEGIETLVTQHSFK